jgi:hypothetical protein
MMKTVVEVVKAVVEAPMTEPHVMEAPAVPRVARESAEHEYCDHRDEPDRQLTVHLLYHTATP